MKPKTLAEAHAELMSLHERAVASAEEAVKAAQRWADAEASYQRALPWCIGILILCGILLAVQP